MANELTNLIKRINDAIKNDRIYRTALTSGLSIHKPRIFEKGLDGSGQKIGTYSTTPISISKKNQARNTGKTYFKGGYNEYKKDIGRNPGYVNLRNTDQMMGDYGMVGSKAYGFQNSVNADKSIWMEEKYQKDIFVLSDRELDTIMNIIADELNKSI